MTWETWFVFGVLGVTVALFALDKLRLDLVALLALMALLVAGVLSPAEALAGFADPLVLIIAGLFVVGGGLLRTGVAAALAAVLGRLTGTHPARVTSVIMLVVAGLSAFMSSTGTVAILLPAVVALARKAGTTAARLLIPLAFASLLGGMLTLIGTPPNLVVSQELEAAGQQPFSFFAFTPIGLVMLALGVGYMALIGRRLLPDRAPAAASVAPGGAGGAEPVTVSELAAAYGLSGHLFQVRVGPDSPLVGRTVEQAAIRRRYELTVVELLRRPVGSRTPRPLPQIEPDTALRAEDELLLQGTPEQLGRFCDEQAVLALPTPDAGAAAAALDDVGLAEVLLPPRSRLLGKSLRQLEFRDRYDVNVLALLRMGTPVVGDVAEVPLRFGDTLLVQGDWKRIRTLRHQQRDFVVVGEPPGERAGPGLMPRSYVAIAILVAMLVVMTPGLVPTVVAVLVAAVLMILTRCLTMEDAYGSMSWQSLVLIAAMLPMATALQSTGGMDLMVEALIGSLGRLGPLVVMAALFAFTSLASQFISNTATTVLVAPVALQTALQMDVSPRTYLIVIAIAASTAFSSPVASPVNTMVLSPGGYRFADYLRAGIGLQLLIGVATVALAPVFFPL